MPHRTIRTVALFRRTGPCPIPSTRQFVARYSGYPVLPAFVDRSLSRMMIPYVEHVRSLARRCGARCAHALWIRYKSFWHNSKLITTGPTAG